MKQNTIFRRLAALGCAALLTLGLAACGENTEPESEASSPYLDGSYTARFDAAGSDGYTTYAVVEISGGKVSVREFDGKNDAGDLRSADTALADSMKENASEYLGYEPTPANLSARAIASLEGTHLLEDDELRGARKVLGAAAMTYVAALLVSLAQLLRFLLAFAGRRRD